MPNDIVAVGDIVIHELKPKEVLNVDKYSRVREVSDGTFSVSGVSLAVCPCNRFTLRTADEIRYFKEELYRVANERNINLKWPEISRFFYERGHRACLEANKIKNIPDVQKEHWEPINEIVKEVREFYLETLEFINKNKMVEVKGVRIF